MNGYIYISTNNNNYRHRSCVTMMLEVWWGIETRTRSMNIPLLALRFNIRSPVRCFGIMNPERRGSEYDWIELERQKNNHRHRHVCDLWSSLIEIYIYIVWSPFTYIYIYTGRRALLYFVKKVTNEPRHTLTSLDRFGIARGGGGWHI